MILRWPRIGQGAGGAWQNLPAQRRRRAGFALLEVMIALAILGSIMTIIWSSFGRTLHSRDYVLAIQERYQTVRQGLNRMLRELSMAYLAQPNSHQGADKRTQTLFKAKREGDGYRVIFSTLGGKRLIKNQNVCDEAILTYYVENDAETGKTNVMRRVRQPLDDRPEEEEDTVSEVLIDDIRKLELEFWDPQQNKWVDSWDTEGVERGRRLPPLVRFKLTVLDEQGKNQVFWTASKIWLVNELGFGTR